MITEQQKQAMHYFRRHADDWEKGGRAESLEKVNVIKIRNDFALKIIRERKKTNSFLDIGCGAGDLVCEVASRGINAIGIDFAEEMIRIAKRNAKKTKNINANFECCSIFDFKASSNTFDAISANGFIEYISYGELDELLNFCWESLKGGGSLIMGSRNRLFNIFSLNEFTQREIDDGSITALLLEAIQIVRSKNIRDLIGFNAAPLQKENYQYKDTGIHVSTRHQFSPAQLVNMLKEKGFEPMIIYPVHIHATTPKFKNRNLSIHSIMANSLQNYADKNMNLLPQSSSFMIHAKKYK